MITLSQSTKSLCTAHREECLQPAQLSAEVCSFRAELVDPFLTEGYPACLLRPTASHRRQRASRGGAARRRGRWACWSCWQSACAERCGRPGDQDRATPAARAFGLVLAQAEPMGSHHLVCPLAARATKPGWSGRAGPVERADQQPGSRARRGVDQRDQWPGGHATQSRDVDRGGSADPASAAWATADAELRRSSWPSRHRRPIPAFNRANRLRPWDARASRERRRRVSRNSEKRPSITAGSSCARRSVLLKQGQCQFDTGAAYATVESYFPTIVNNNLTQGFFHRRLGYVPAQIRYGLTDRAQLYANCPVGYVCSEQTVLGSYANYSGRGGTGDTNLGCSYWLRKSNGMPFDPDVIATVGMTIPTAPASFLSAFNTPQTSLGQGFWAATWNLLVVQSFDPVTIFYGVGGRQLFGKDVERQLHPARPAIHLSIGGRLCRQRTGHLQRELFWLSDYRHLHRSSTGGRFGPRTAIHAIRRNRLANLPHHRALRADRHDGRRGPEHHRHQHYLLVNRVAPVAAPRARGTCVRF